MSFIKNLFKDSSSKEKKNNIHWIPLNDLSQLEEIKEFSNSEPVLIFKHSTRCGISRMVIKQFENKFTEGMKNIKIYYLDLLAYRHISDEVGYAFQVLHQSPQLLIIKNGIAISNASHYEITRLDLTNLAS
jgi:bacillithiol system protein YtxJ